MNTLITKGLGPNNQLITQGFGGLVVVIDPSTPSVIPIGGTGGGGFLLKKYVDDGLIRTKIITIPWKTSFIKVEAILLNAEDYSRLQATLEDAYQGDILVFAREEVEYDD